MKHLSVNNKVLSIVPTTVFLAIVSLAASCESSSSALSTIQDGSIPITLSEKVIQDIQANLLDALPVKRTLTETFNFETPSAVVTMKNAETLVKDQGFYVGNQTIKFQEKEVGTDSDYWTNESVGLKWDTTGGSVSFLGEGSESILSIPFSSQAPSLFVAKPAELVDGLPTGKAEFDYGGLHYETGYFEEANAAAIKTTSQSSQEGRSVSFSAVYYFYPNKDGKKYLGWHHQTAVYQEGENKISLSRSCEYAYEWLGGGLQSGDIDRNNLLGYSLDAPSLRAYPSLTCGALLTDGLARYDDSWAFTDPIAIRSCLDCDAYSLEGQRLASSDSLCVAVEQDSPLSVWEFLGRKQ